MKLKTILVVLLAACGSLAVAMNREIPYAEQVCGADAIVTGKIVRVRHHYIKNTEAKVEHYYDEADLKVSKVYKGKLSTGKVYGIVYLSTDQPPRPYKGPPPTDSGGVIEKHVEGEEATWFMRRESFTGNFFFGCHSKLQYDEDVSKAISEAKCGE